MSLFRAREKDIWKYLDYRNKAIDKLNANKTRQGESCKGKCRGAKNSCHTHGQMDTVRKEEEEPCMSYDHVQYVPIPKNRSHGREELRKIDTTRVRLCFQVAMREARVTM